MEKPLHLILVDGSGYIFRAFEANATLRGALGEEFSAAYSKLKRAEWDSYARHLSVWEHDHTLDC